MSLGVIVTALSLFTAACGDDKKESGGGETKDVGTSDAKDLKRGGTLTMALEAESTGGWCLPSGQLAVSGIMVHNAIYDPLVAYDENYVPQPYLAESVTPNADFTEWTFKLRPGVKFHDGTDLTADIVKQNIDLAWGEPDLVAKTGISPVLFRIVYNTILGTTAVDPLTVSVQMKSSWPTYLSFLAGGRNGIMGQKQIDAGKDGCKDTLVGTGPFKLEKPEDWVRNQQMTLQKNADYWRMGADGQKLPYLDTLIFKPIEGGENRYSALEAGSIDAGHFSTASIFAQIQAQSDKFDLTKEVEGHKEVGYGLVDVSQPPFDNQEVRLAMGQAIDRDALNLVSNDGEFEIANQPFDTKTLGYVDGLEGPKYDPDAAAAFFQGKNIAFPLTYASDPNTKLLAEEIKRQLGEVGVDVTIAETDQSSLITKALGGGFGVLLWRNHPGADPDTQTSWWRSGYLTNFGRINDPELDRLLDTGRIETDPAKRKEIYQGISQLFAEKGYNLWNWYTEWAVGSDKKVKQLGYNTLPDGSKGTGLNWGWTYLTEVWLDQ